MTSQKWLNDSDFAPNSPAQSIWWHIIAVIVPDNLKFKNNATLWIAGAYQTSKIPNATNFEQNPESYYRSANLACVSQMIVGVLFEVRFREFF